jgi:hypothetical protein
MLNIQDKVFVSISIDDQEVPYSNLMTIDLTEGNAALMPALKIVMSDPASVYKTGDHALTDGNKISIVIAKSINDNKVAVRKYRLFAHKASDNPLNPVMTLVGILDAPKFTTSSVIEAYEGTSDDVLRTVAANGGLTYSGLKEFNGVTAGDSQVWRNVGKNRAVFVQEIARRGWVNNRSGMMCCPTSYGELRYRNLMDVINSKLDKVKFALLHNALNSDTDKNRKCYVVRQAKDHSAAGIMASWTNYGSTRTQPTLDGDGKSLTSMEVKLPGSFLAINKEISDMVGRARRDIAPVDRGNVHEKHEEAVYQNIKALALFSQKMSLLTEEVTELQLLDPVIYRQEDADFTKPVSNSDIYIVVGKTIVIRAGAFYGERIEIERFSLTMKGTADLKMPGTTPSEKGMLPDVTINKQASDTQQKAATSNLKKLRDQIAAVKAAIAPIKVLMKVIHGDMGPVRDAMQQLSNSIAAGDPNNTSLAAKLLTTTLNTLSGNLTNLKNWSQVSKQLNSNLTGVLAAQVPTIKTSTLNGPDCTIAGLGNQASINMPLLGTSHAVQGLYQKLPYGIAASPVGANLFGAVSVFDNGVKSIAGDWVAQWNDTVACVKDVKEIPDLKTDAGFATVQALNTKLKDSTSESQLTTFLAGESQKSTNQQPNWISVEALTAREQAVQSTQGFVDNVNAYYTRLGKVVG